MSKSLLIVLFGEPRGIGNSNDCPGTNQFDAILQNETLMRNVDKIHVHWSITVDRVSFPWWDNTYMIDRNGDRWEATEYLPDEQILNNVHKFMQPYNECVTYDIHLRKSSRLRWGKEYHHSIMRGLNEDYDFVMFHRPDSNLDVEGSDFYRVFEKFFHTETPAVCVTACPTDTLWKAKEEGISDIPHAGFWITWNAYEIMLWNKKGLRLLERFIRLKSEHEQDYLNITDNSSEWFHDDTKKYQKLLQSWNNNQRIDQAETLWGVTLLAISTFAHDFVVLDALPFRSLIRKQGNV